MEKLAYSIPNAAKMLDVSPNHVRRLIARGALPHVRLGGRVLVPAKALRELLDALANAQDAPGMR